jgi:serine/threonine-protein kinase RsbT
MKSIKDVVSDVMTHTLPAIALQSIMSTIPNSTREAGTLDVISVQAILSHLEVGLRTFTTKVDLSLLGQVRRALTLGKAPLPTKVTIDIASDVDVVTAMRYAQHLTRPFFAASDVVRLATAVSELSRNIYMYARRGTVVLHLSEDDLGVQFELVASDEGPGIPKEVLSFTGTYVSKTGLGKGLFGTRSLLDDFTVASAPGKTVITGKKRVRRKTQ